MSSEFRSSARDTSVSKWPSVFALSARTFTCTNAGPVSGVKAASGLGIDPAEMVLLDAGVVPHVELARDAGIQIGVTGAISVNAYMETNVPCIFAAGNCAETFCAIRR